MPSSEHALVPPNKIFRYLLDPTNPRSRGKPAIFFALGYTREEWYRLADDLCRLAQSDEIADIEVADTVQVDNIDSLLRGPNGLERWIRSIWQVNAGGRPPRFITAFPAPRRNRR
jgi:hypothetical protein